MNPVDRATIVHYHRHRIASFGAGQVRALGWRAETSQQRRFATISGAADCAHARVLDLGCGHGDLKPWLDARFDGVFYVGVDQVPEFIDEARRRHGHCPRSAFYCADFGSVALPESDVVVACGALSYRTAEPDHVFHMLRRMWAACAGTLVVNLLDRARFPDHPLLVGHDPAEAMALADALCPHARLLQDRDDDAADDFTVVMQRRPDAAPGCA